MLKPAEVRQAQRVAKNIRQFFSDFDRDRLDSWGEHNPYADYAGSLSERWLVPSVPGAHRMATRCCWYMSYDSGPQHVQARPQLGTLLVDAAYSTVDEFALNLGTYSHGGQLRMALGFMPHPQLRPIGSRNARVDKWIQFVDLDDSSVLPHGRSGLYNLTVMYRVGNTYSFSAPGPEYAFETSHAETLITRKSFVSAIGGRVGHVVVVVTATNFRGENTGDSIQMLKQKLDIAMLAPRGKFRQLGSLLASIEASTRWIWLSPHGVKHLPSDPPNGFVGVLDHADPIMADLLK